jgi:hypothetical protein
MGILSYDGQFSVQGEALFGGDSSGTAPDYRHLHPSHLILQISFLRMPEKLGDFVTHGSWSFDNQNRPNHKSGEAALGVLRFFAAFGPSNGYRTWTQCARSTPGTTPHHSADLTQIRPSAKFH